MYITQFSTPAFAVPNQLPYLPMTFITYDVATTDGKDHKVKLYYDNTAEVSQYTMCMHVQVACVLYNTFMYYCI